MALHSNYGPILYRFRDKAIFFYRKSRYFNTHLHGTPVRAAGGPCLNIAVAIVAYRKKTRIVVLAEGEESLRILFVSIQYNVHKRVRLTEGQTDTARRQRPRYAQRRAEKKSVYFVTRYSC